MRNPSYSGLVFGFVAFLRVSVLSRPFDICDVPFKELTEISDLIFTGKIESLVSDDDRGRNNKFAIIRIKRIIRLNEKSFQNVTSGTKVSVKLTWRYFDDGHKLTNKFGNCSENGDFNDVRIRDTKIFCGRLVDKGSIVFESFTRDRRVYPHELLGISLPLKLHFLDGFAELEGMFR